MLGTTLHVGGVPCRSLILDVVCVERHLAARKTLRNDSASEGRRFAEDWLALPFGVWF